ncbi:cell division protein ZapE, partial [Alphaproteobacteria bacterium]|nr:cell division protein ZapE [Alphaproteobacteria bacterium]
MEKHIDATLETTALIESIKLDSGQLFVIKYFNTLFEKINSLNINSNIINKFFFKNNNIIKGIYLFGGVGRGKSMLMDLFFQNVDIKEKRRLHFHDFMKEVHQRVLEKSKVERNKDCVLLVAKDLAKSAKLLCFDEMEVRDIADAMILS